MVKMLVRLTGKVREKIVFTTKINQRFVGDETLKHSLVLKLSSTLTSFYVSAAEKCLSIVYHC